MAIAKMTKFTLLTFRDHRAALLKDLQKFGDVHLKNLQADDLDELDFLKPEYSVQEITRYENDLERVGFTISKLGPYAPKAKMTAVRPTLAYEEFDGYLGGYDYGAVCRAVKEQDEVIASVKSETTRLKAENDNLKSWLGLDVAPTELNSLTAAKALVGTVNKMTAESMRETLEQQFPAIYLEYLGNIKEDTAALLLIPAEYYDDVFSAAKDLGFAKANLSFTDVPSEIIERNNRRISGLEKEGAEALEKIKSMSGEHGQLLIVRDCLKTLLARETACQNLLASDAVVMMEGWVPEEDDAPFKAILKQVCGDNYYLEEEAVDRDDMEVPIKLKNNKFVSSFEDITIMYSLPHYNEFDPTPLLAPFYWLFFGLMVGDMGYGLLMLVATTIALKVMDLKAGMKKFMQFFFFLSFGVIVGGALYGSLFGVTVLNPIRAINEAGVVYYKPILSTETDIIQLLLMSVALGVLHIIFGLLIKGAWHLKRGEIASAIFDSLFWIITLLSGITLIVGATGILPSNVQTACWYVFWASIVGLALTQGRESPSLGGKIGNGLYGVYGLSGYVGDLVSYTRIVALALSGAYIAFSFNLMGTEVIPAGPFGLVRIIFGGLVIVLGQTLNVGLALLGAYVHTCRLQYVEFFGKFYEGGGVPFAPLKLQNESIHINK